MYTKICTVSHKARVRVTSIYQSWIIYYCDVSGREETNIYTAPTVGQLQASPGMMDTSSTFQMCL